MQAKAADAPLPLVGRFPALATLPRATLCTLPTPVERIVHGGRTLLIKRDDVNASPVGGNKVRGLEWLLGGIPSGSRVVTVGPTGSNHALATTLHARALGMSVVVLRWNQHMNDAARAVDRRLRDAGGVVDAGSVVGAYAIALLHRLRGAHWIPAGGASPLAILGHVNAGLELADQVRSGASPLPTRIFVPLGTGGTAAGLALAVRLAGLQVPLTLVRVVPRVLGGARRVAALANRTAALIERLSGQFVPRVSAHELHVEHRFYGGEYGRPLRDIEHTHATLRSHGIALDDTYTAKACAAALADSTALPLLWLTFDGRVLAPTPPDGLTQ